MRSNMSGLLNKDLISLLEGLKKVGDLKGVKFAYAVAKNLSFIETEVIALQASIKPNESIQAYENERIALCKSFNKKTDEGTPVIHNNEYVIDESVRPVFDEKMKALNEAHSKVLDERKDAVKDFNELMEEESDVDLHFIHIDLIPEDITANQLSDIHWIIED